MAEIGRSSHPDRYTESLRRFFDADAPEYDYFTRANNYTRHNTRLKMALERRLSLGWKVGSLLDLGTGTGQTIAAVTEVAEPQRVVAVDFSGGMIDKLKHKNLAGIEAVEADIRDYVAVNQESFDLIVAGSVLEFIPELPQFLQQAARLLNPDGALGFTYIPREPGEPAYKDMTWGKEETFRQYAWFREEISEALAASGLVMEEHDSFEAYKQGDMPVIYDFALAGASADSFTSG